MVGLSKGNWDSYLVRAYNQGYNKEMDDIDILDYEEAGDKVKGLCVITGGTGSSGYLSFIIDLKKGRITFSRPY